MQFEKVQHRISESANGFADGMHSVDKASAQPERDYKINLAKASLVIFWGVRVGFRVFGAAFGGWGL